MRARTLLAALATSLLAAGAPRPAEACGGCFAPPETITTVDSHRMVISLSPERTTLWDQIRYSGDPQDFVWVLPVPSAAATIDLAPEAFFAELEAQTAPQVNPPPLNFGGCALPPGGGFPTSGAEDADGSGDDGVTVYHEKVVGPYQTVTIGSESATALHSWLTNNGYNIPSETLPVIQYYVEQKSVFIAMRLAPTEDVDAMQPVRVRYPGYMATFPLKMVTVGASGSLDLSLWVIAEQRYEARNYTTTRVAESDLVWDWATFSSNYGDLFLKAIDDAGGRAWVTEFAQPLSALWFTTPEEAEIASVGLPYPYVTRLRTTMLTDYLTDDLELMPASDTSDIWRVLQASKSINDPPAPTCPDWDGDGQPDTLMDELTDPARDFTGRGCAVAPGGRGATLAGLALAAALAAFAALVLITRRRR